MDLAQILEQDFYSVDSQGNSVKCDGITGAFKEISKTVAAFLARDDDEEARLGFRLWSSEEKDTRPGHENFTVYEIPKSVREEAKKLPGFGGTKASPTHPGRLFIAIENGSELEAACSWPPI